jgi:cyclophilin family peptidyl-prolyl cis-trans isomerase
MCALGISLFQLVPAQAATIVDVHTSLGSFKIELFEDLAPGPVARVLYNVSQGRYDSTIFHFADDASIAGGDYVFNRCEQGPVEARPYDISVRGGETGLENLTGTFAVLRDPHNPEFITRDWIINLQDNIALDPALAPVVIGEVVEGFDTVVAIRNQSRLAMEGVSSSVPVIHYEGHSTVDCAIFDKENLIFLDMDSGARDRPGPINSYDPDDGELRLKVDAGEDGLWSVTLLSNADASQLLFEIVPESFVEEYEAVEGFASFDSGSGLLQIPELYLNGELAFRNLVMRLVDGKAGRFNLDSYEVVASESQ